MRSLFVEIDRRKTFPSVSLSVAKAPATNTTKHKNFNILESTVGNSESWTDFAGANAHLFIAGNQELIAGTCNYDVSVNPLHNSIYCLSFIFRGGDQK